MGGVKEFMKIVFDLDSTICDTQGVDYIHSRPISKVINKINECYYNGDIIIIFTARGTKSGIDHRQLTENQLRAWGVKYHELLFGKLDYMLWVDDKAINVKDFIK